MAELVLPSPLLPDLLPGHGECEVLLPDLHSRFWHCVRVRGYKVLAPASKSYTEGFFDFVALGFVYVLQEVLLPFISMPEQPGFLFYLSHGQSSINGGSDGLWSRVGREVCTLYPVVRVSAYIVVEGRPGSSGIEDMW